jgi:phosphate:Na+ symporter
MDYQVLSNIILLFAGMGIFMVAIHMTSESMEKISSSKLRHMLNKVSGNKLAGVGIGAGVTALIQSSSATTVMVVGMVNAGIMTLIQATYIIMGANIGTTITGVLSALPTLSSGESFPVTDLFMVLSFVGVIISIIAKTDKIKTWGTFLAGLGTIFVALKCMSISMEFMQTDPTFQELIKSVTNPILLLVIGALFTGLVQSSAIVAGIVITMVGQGIQIGAGGNAVLFIILGTNIGTCVTAMLAGIGSSPNGKRASFIHLLFNVIGSIIFTVFLLLYPGFYDRVMVGLFGDNHGLIVAAFHVMFNVISTVIMFPFAKYLVSISKLVFKDKKQKSRFVLQYIDDRILATPSIAVEQLLKETERIAVLTRQSLSLSVESFLKLDSSKSQKVKDIQEEVNFLVEEITRFLIKLSGYDLSGRDERVVSNLHYIISDFERIADLSSNIMRYTSNAESKNLAFSDAIIAEIKDMFEAIDSMYGYTMDDFIKRSNEHKREIDALEDEVDELRSRNLENHYQRMNKGECNPESGGIYVNTVNNLERAADHLKFISQKEF